VKKGLYSSIGQALKDSSENTVTVIEEKSESARLNGIVEALLDEIKKGKCVMFIGESQHKVDKVTTLLSTVIGKKLDELFIVRLNQYQESISEETCGVFVDGKTYLQAYNAMLMGGKNPFLVWMERVKPVVFVDDISQVMKMLVTPISF
jgi:hypothetical protein